MLRSIGIGNFKAFGRTQEIKIRPITLIYGENGSGKSSILHSLSFIKSTYTSRNCDSFSVSGKEHDAIDFSQLKHMHSVSNPNDAIFNITTDIKINPSDSPDCEIRDARIELSIGYSSRAIVSLSGCAVETARLTHFNISIADNTLFSTTGSDDSRPLTAIPLPEINFSTPPNISDLLYPSIVYHPPIGALNHLIQRVNPDVPEVTANDAPEIAEIIGQLKFEYDQFIPQLLPSRAFEHDFQDNKLELIRKLIINVTQSLLDATRNIIQKYRHIGPIRPIPSRRDAGVDWGQIWANQHCLESINRWISSEDRMNTPYCIKIRRMRDLDRVLSLVDDSLTDIEIEDVTEFVDGEEIHRAQLSERSLTEMMDSIRSYCTDDPDKVFYKSDEIVFRDITRDIDVSHLDIGVGISQVIPVLGAAYGLKGHIIAIEQPELHLHPASQAELVDVFIESALGEAKNTFLLESHSENMLLRIMRRMRETAEGRLPANARPITPDDVSVLFVQRDGKESIVSEMPLDPKGRLMKSWPGGFFEEGLREVL